MAFPSTTDGAVEVDSNVGTVDELKAEIATETPKPHGTGRAAPVQRVAVEEKPDAESEAGDDRGDGVSASDDAAGDAARAAGGDAAAVAGGGKKKKSIQARIDDIRADLGTTERERDQSRAEVARLQGELDALKGKPAGKKAEYDGVAFTEQEFPKFAKWLETHPDGELEDWSRADRRWEAAKDAQAREQVTAQDRARTEHAERFTPLAKTYVERIEPVLKADPTFYDKIDARLLETPAQSALAPGVKPTFGNFLVEQVIRSEVPDKLLVHLSDPKVIRRLMTLPPQEILREIMRFEVANRPADADTGPSADDHDEDDEPPARRRVEAATHSEASPPVKPVRGSSQQSAGQEPGDDASDDEWYRWEQSQAAKKRQGSLRH